MPILVCQPTTAVANAVGLQTSSFNDKDPLAASWFLFRTFLSDKRHQKAPEPNTLCNGIYHILGLRSKGSKASPSYLGNYYFRFKLNPFVTSAIVDLKVLMSNSALSFTIHQDKYLRFCQCYMDCLLRDSLSCPVSSVLLWVRTPLRYPRNGE